MIADPAHGSGRAANHGTNRYREVVIIKERYKISYGLQYDAWELELRLPDWEEYRTEREAREKIGNRTVSALLAADAIFLFYDGMEICIPPEPKEIYRFAFIKEETYGRLGPPLSPGDLDRLIEKDMLEEVIFSSRYILTENDYTEFPGSLTDAFLELRRSRKPEIWEKSGGEKLTGYLFESVWYQAERIG